MKELKVFLIEQKFLSLDPKKFLRMKVSKNRFRSDQEVVNLQNNIKINQEILKNGRLKKDYLKLQLNGNMSYGVLTTKYFFF